MSRKPEQIRIAICDDEILLLPQLESIVKNALRLKSFSPEVQTFSSPAALLHELYSGLLFNVYLLDIDMPEQDGISLAQKIRITDPDPLILYVSAKEELVYKTFRTQPVAFIRKSHFKEDMEEGIDLICTRLRRPPDKVVLFYDELRHEHKLNISKLMYVEAKEKYQKLVGVNGCSMLRCSISDLEKALIPYDFCRIHRGYLVNLQYVHRIDASSVLLDSGQRLPLSRGRKKEMLRQFQNYLSQIVKR